MGFACWVVVVVGGTGMVSQLLDTVPDRKTPSWCRKYRNGRLLRLVEITVNQKSNTVHSPDTSLLITAILLVLPILVCPSLFNVIFLEELSFTNASPMHPQRPAEDHMVSANAAGGLHGDFAPSGLGRAELPHHQRRPSRTPLRKL